jgi:hypothetical protein
MPSPNWPSPAGRNEAQLRATSLRLHNEARAEFGVAPLRWNDWLESEALGYAQQMARTGVFAHDRTPGRRAKMGENLWSGTKGAYSYDVMVGVMVDESAHFIPGEFPNNSRTGVWQQVSHYTQIVWPTTTEVGCAMVSSRSTDYYVCRYAPTGNIDGVALVPRNADIQLAQGSN